jgi:NTP pyrophosphatase (non-canonical NTP hydrolase)
MYLFENSKDALKLAEYASRAGQSNQFGDDAASLNQLRYGLFGEVGGLLTAVKKAKRDQLESTEKASAEEELGDALWYLTAIARHHQLDLSIVGKAAITDLERRLGVSDNANSSVEDLTFRQIDGLLAYGAGKITESKDQLLCELARHTGDALSSPADEPSNFASTPGIGPLSKIFTNLVLVSAKFDLSIARVAFQNLRKIESRWPLAGTNAIQLFDENCSHHEQLPRKLDMHFIEREENGKKFVVQQWKGVNIGDRLTDNRSDGDGYRFHDVFHLAYMAHLGWSPVIRSLLKVKRKSNPDIDENQDGARAIIIEEGIATWIFNHARSRNSYEGVVPGKLEYGLLKQVCDMVSGYEVAACPLWQWEKAILDGFAVFRKLCTHSGGIVKVDMEKHTINFEPPAVLG